MARQTARVPSLLRLPRTALALAVVLALAGCGARAQWHDGAARPTPTPPPVFVGWSDPAGVGRPYGSKVNGLLTFRGNPTRTYYGTGPAARTLPTKLWQFPKDSDMCGLSHDERGYTTWCGNGWTGQPTVFERDGRTWVVFGAYDFNVHFLDANTGERILPDFPTGDLVKGSSTVDPDGYPLVYVGSRDNNYRVIAIDGGKPRELWRLNADDVHPTMFNNDWDGASLVIDDYLFEGGENSQFHIVKLNRGYDANGKVTVAPKLVFHAPGWDDDLLKGIGDNNVSIENSVAIYKDTVYFANSGGLVQGWDISGLKDGVEPRRVFRYWTGDDTDATIAIDSEGMLYVGVEYVRHTARSEEVGQMIKLDPSRPDPLVWKQYDKRPVLSGVLGSPALYQDIAIFDTDYGDVIGLDRANGTERWRFHLPRTWASPVVVDGVLFIGDCTGHMSAYDVSDTHAAPTQLWTMKVAGCIEATPAVWKGVLYFGARTGKEYAFAAPSPTNPPR